ncbi:MAG: DUF971 domain-containing protein [Gammaproteobacteria bacterium]|nr:DUF971 domain-containing protein [Gammaproteobacteria bacterium]MCP5137134.1 DUF971 domain-containing protein [Gammaproteobacteria bacterium]
MSDAHPTPTEISLHEKSRVLVVSFDDGARFELPCEYLRVFSKAAEVQSLKTPVSGKETVNIDKIEPQGSYALRLYFDDGHDTGIYSWGTLYSLGKNFEANWAGYLKRLEDLGIQRRENSGRRNVKVLYFANLVRELEKTQEDVMLPPSVKTVADLLALLRRRGKKWPDMIADDKVKVTINRQFAELFSKLEDGDEIGIVQRPEVGKV